MREALKSRYDFDKSLEENYSIQDGISETVPDQSTKLSELVARQKRGQEVRQFKPEWTGATSFEEWKPEWEKLDKIERQIALEQVRDNINQIRQKLSEEAKQKASQEWDELIKAEVTKAQNAKTTTEDAKSEG